MLLFRMMQRMSPLGLLAGGIVVASFFPAIRRGLRSAAVMATAGVLSATDSIKNVLNNAKDDMSTDVQDVQE